MNNIAPKLKNAEHIISKVLKQPNFFYSQHSTLPKDASSKFYLSMTFGLSFMICSVAPIRLSTFLHIFSLRFIIPRTVLLSSVQPKAENLDLLTHAVLRNL